MNNAKVCFLRPEGSGDSSRGRSVFAQPPVGKEKMSSPNGAKESELAARFSVRKIFSLRGLTFRQPRPTIHHRNLNLV